MMNHTPITEPTAVTAALTSLAQRLQALKSNDLARVAELAGTGRSQVWNLRAGRNSGSVDVALRVEAATTQVELDLLNP
ncbi:hypothetical protein [Deinococcus radiotolerans]|uniref:HTH cro/C1-type domain-containing protein n=1 Tax=Deinococcus radiotolerans TaxID=1309407 RepID=A0ABQ2FQ11_9DEIO|nr:hypothetical protein [Deinococcus radiotolerans]GGL15586.1 hypothetical protein GCM10010844_38110 [Deinococcus radiotolerans]